MRRHGIVLVCMVVLLFGSAVVSQAQSVDMVKASIPFSFVVGQKVMPAGSYIITRLSYYRPDLGRVVRSSDGRNTAIILAGEMDRSAHGKPALVFHRYGDTYFLSGIRSTSFSMFFYSSAEAKVLAKRKTNRPAVIAANQ